jgi:hypothetical protein
LHSDASPCTSPCATMTSSVESVSRLSSALPHVRFVATDVARTIAIIKMAGTAPCTPVSATASSENVSMMRPSSPGTHARLQNALATSSSMLSVYEFESAASTGTTPRSTICAQMLRSHERLHSAVVQRRLMSATTDSCTSTSWCPNSVWRARERMVCTMPILSRCGPKPLPCATG